MARADKESTQMARFTSAALLALGLAACSPIAPDARPAINHGLTSANQPVVQRTDYVFDVAASGGVPASEQARLSAWFESLQLGYGDRIAIDEPQGYADAQSRADIAGVAAQYGLLLSDGAPISAGQVQPGSVRVIVSRTTASVPGCPVYEDPQIGTAISDRTSTNYGCAHNSNLAAMIADPNDLVLGQTGSGNDNNAGSKAIKTYRDKAPTGAGALKTEGSKQ